MQHYTELTLLGNKYGEVIKTATIQLQVKYVSVKVVTEYGISYCDVPIDENGYILKNNPFLQGKPLDAYDKKNVCAFPSGKKGDAIKLDKSSDLVYNPTTGKFEPPHNDNTPPTPPKKKRKNSVDYSTFVLGKELLDTPISNENTPSNVVKQEVEETIEEEQTTVTTQSDVCTDTSTKEDEIIITKEVEKYSEELDSKEEEEKEITVEENKTIETEREEEMLNTYKEEENENTVEIVSEVHETEETITNVLIDTETGEVIKEEVNVKETKEENIEDEWDDNIVVDPQAISINELIEEDEEETLDNNSNNTSYDDDYDYEKNKDIYEDGYFNHGSFEERELDREKASIEEPANYSIADRMSQEVDLEEETEMITRNKQMYNEMAYDYLGITQSTLEEEELLMSQGRNAEEYMKSKDKVCFESDCPDGVDWMEYLEAKHNNTVEEFLKENWPKYKTYERNLEYTKDIEEIENTSSMSNIKFPLNYTTNLTNEEDIIDVDYVEEEPDDDFNYEDYLVDDEDDNEDDNNEDEDDGDGDIPKDNPSDSPTLPSSPSALDKEDIDTEETTELAVVGTNEEIDIVEVQLSAYEKQLKQTMKYAKGLHEIFVKEESQFVDMVSLGIKLSNFDENGKWIPDYESKIDSIRNFSKNNSRYVPVEGNTLRDVPHDRPIVMINGVPHYHRYMMDYSKEEIIKIKKDYLRKVFIRDIGREPSDVEIGLVDVDAPYDPSCERPKEHSIHPTPNDCPYIQGYEEHAMLKNPLNDDIRQKVDYKWEEGEWFDKNPFDYMEYSSEEQIQSDLNNPKITLDTGKFKDIPDDDGKLNNPDYWIHFLIKAIIAKQHEIRARYGKLYGQDGHIFLYPFTSYEKWHEIEEPTNTIHVQEKDFTKDVQGNDGDKEWNEICAKLDENGTYKDENLVCTFWETIQKQVRDVKATKEYRADTVEPCWEEFPRRSLLEIDIEELYEKNPTVAIMKVRYFINNFLLPGLDDIPCMYPCYIPMSKREVARARKEQRERLYKMFVPLEELGRNIIDYDINTLPEEQEAYNEFHVSAITVDNVYRIMDNMVPIDFLVDCERTSDQHLILDTNLLLWEWDSKVFPKDGVQLRDIISPRNFIRCITPKQLLYLIKLVGIHGMTKDAYKEEKDRVWDHPSLDIVPFRLIYSKTEIEPFYEKFYDDPELLYFNVDFDHTYEEGGDLSTYPVYQRSYTYLVADPEENFNAVANYAPWLFELGWLYNKCKNPFRIHDFNEMMNARNLARQFTSVNKYQEKKTKPTTFSKSSRLSPIDPKSGIMQFQGQTHDISKNQDGSYMKFLPTFTPYEAVSLWDIYFHEAFPPYFEAFIGKFLGPNFNPDEFFHEKLCKFMVLCRRNLDAPMRFKNENEICYVKNKDNFRWRAPEASPDGKTPWISYSFGPHTHKYRIWQKHIDALDSILKHYLYYTRYFAEDNGDFRPDIASIDTKISKALYDAQHGDNTLLNTFTFRRNKTSKTQPSMKHHELQDYHMVNKIMCHHIVPIKFYKEALIDYGYMEGRTVYNTDHLYDMFNFQYIKKELKWNGLYKDPDRIINGLKLVEYRNVDIEQKVRMDTYFWMVRSQLEPFELCYLYWNDFIVPKEYYLERELRRDKYERELNKKQGIPILPKGFKEFGDDEGFVAFFDWSGMCWMVKDPWNLPKGVTHMNPHLFSFHQNIGVKSKNKLKKGNYGRIVDCKALYIPIYSTGKNRNDELPYFNFYHRYKDKKTKQLGPFLVPKQPMDLKKGHNKYLIYVNKHHCWALVKKNKYYKVKVGWERTFNDKGRDAITRRWHEKNEYGNRDFVEGSAYRDLPWDTEFPYIDELDENIICVPENELDFDLNKEF